MFGKARRSVLGLLFTHSDRAYYLREIARLTGLSPGALQRELARLTAAGLLARRRDGRQVYYRANRESPLFTEIRSLMVKTSGVADVLRGVLEPLFGKVRVAFVYGSMAKGAETSGSDVDVMVIGDVSFRKAVEVLGGAQEALGREVNPSVYSAREFRRRASSREHFVRALLRGPKVFLIGDEDELARLAR